MEKLKELWGKYKKIIIALLLLFLLIILITTKGFGLFKSGSLNTKVGKYDLTQTDSFSYIWTFENEQKLIFFGEVKDLNKESSFLLKDEDANQVVVYFKNLETNKITADIGKLENDDYAIVEGTWDINMTAIVAKNIVRIEKEKALELINAQRPLLEIEIVEYPENITHTCETLKFKLKLTNTGQIPVSHADLYNRDYDYALYFFIDGVHRIANSDREDYEQLKEELDDLTQIGLLSNEGFIYFDEIKPGKSTTVEYWGGGKITQSLYSDLFNDDGTNRRAGISGEHNIFSRKDKGDHELYFSWGKKNNWENPEFLTDSNKVSINLIDNECHNTEENITDTFMVEPLL